MRMTFLPPISRWTFLNVGAAAWFTMRPTRVEPVNDTTLTRSSVVKAVPTSSSPVTMFTTPFGTPASIRMLTKFSADSGVCDEGLKTTVLPQTSAGMIFHDGIAIGKFQGVMIEKTTSGCGTEIETLLHNL